MACRDVRTQADLDAAIRSGDHPRCVGNGKFVAWGSAHVEASPYVAVHDHSEDAVVIGGTVIRVRRPTTIIEWCAFHGVPIQDGHVVLYKALCDDYRSAHGLLYQPGTMVEAPDWDGGEAECGGGLHFAPHPALAMEFDADAQRFVACPVALEDLRPPGISDHFPNKIKARRTAQVIWEVDGRGRPVPTAPTDGLT